MRAAASRSTVPARWEGRAGKRQRGLACRAEVAPVECREAPCAAPPSVPPRRGASLLAGLRGAQDIDCVQKAVAHSLGMRQHDVEAVCRRAGGGFGGKAMRNLPVAVGAAVAAVRTGRPVRFVQDRWGPQAFACLAPSAARPPERRPRVCPGFRPA